MLFWCRTWNRNGPPLVCPSLVRQDRHDMAAKQRVDRTVPELGDVKAGSWVEAPDQGRQFGRHLADAEVLAERLGQRAYDDLPTLHARHRLQIEAGLEQVRSALAGDRLDRLAFQPLDREPTN